LLVEQNVAVALALARRCYLLDRGRVVAEGDAASFGKDARVARAYLGLDLGSIDETKPGNAFDPAGKLLR